VIPHGSLDERSGTPVSDDERGGQAGHSRRGIEYDFSNPVLLIFFWRA
jgi:hypothetical protein